MGKSIRQPDMLSAPVSENDERRKLIGGERRISIMIMTTAYRQYSVPGSVPTASF